MLGLLMLGGLRVYGEKNDTVASATGSGILSEMQIDKLLKDNRVVFIDGKPEPEQKQAVLDSIRREISVFLL